MPGLTVLRNPVYVGKVFFRDALHDGPHRHLVDEKLFDRVQALLHVYERTDLFSAFESGTLSEAQWGKRLEGLAAKVRDLRERREELFVAMEHASARAPHAGEIAAMRHHIEQALSTGAVPARKALLQSLVHEIRVESRDRVVPWFRVPGGAEPKVRALARSAHRKPSERVGDAPLTHTAVE